MARRARTDLQDHLDQLDLQATLVLLVDPETLEPQARSDSLVARVLWAHQDNRVCPVTQDLLVHLVW